MLVLSLGCLADKPLQLFFFFEIFKKGEKRLLFSWLDVKHMVVKE